MNPLKKIHATLFLQIVFVVYSYAGTVFPIEGHGLLWRISRNGLTSSSYLFGTFHSNNAIQILDSIDGFQSAFQSCNQYAGEIYLGSDSSLKGYNDPHPLSIEKKWPTDSTYEKIFSKVALESLDSFVQGNKLLESCIKYKVRPSILKSWAQHYVDASNKKDSLLNKSISLDRKLQNKALALDYKIYGLETLKDRYDLFKLLFKDYGKTQSYKAEGKSLIDYIRHHQLYDSLYNENNNLMLNKYLNQDIRIDTLRFGIKIGEQYPVIDLNLDNRIIYLYIIEKRNAFWMKKISELIQTNPTFISVGAFHLSGEFGLINQLRELGYTVENVK